MIKKLDITELDKSKLIEAGIDRELLKDDFFDYSKAIVRKPWGYEYLIYQNGLVSVWILHIKKGCRTSMHCHPNKKTSLIALSGKCICSTLKEKTRIKSGDGLLIPKGVFHSTEASSEDGAFVMETETSTNKRDLVRVEDRYGRVGMGYETNENVSYNLKNYNYISLINPTIYYNVKKNFGECSISIAKFKSYDEFKWALDFDDSAITILKGKLTDREGNAILDIGDTMDVGQIKHYASLSMENEVEAIIIKKKDNAIKISDYISSFFGKQKIKDVFLAIGSSNVHLLDSIGKNTDISHICTQTEQAATTAAEAYSKLTGNFGVAIVSSGIAGINALGGVADAWVDSTPLMIISGQCHSDQTTSGKLRQLGVQELDIVNIARPITKYAVKIEDPFKVRYHLEKAIYLAKSGRPGPVWIDIPIDIQGMSIDEKEMNSFDPSGIDDAKDYKFLETQINDTIASIKESKRPVILAGNGIRLANSQERFARLADMLGIPVLTSRKGSDLVPDGHYLFFGRSGAYGQRSANFIIQNSDLLIAIGARLSIPQIGRNYKAFARKAKKIVVDIDKNELEKITVKPDIAINCSAEYFISAMLQKFEASQKPDITEWIGRCRSYKSRFSSVDIKENEDSINAYRFVNCLSQELEENDSIIVDGGSPIIYFMQAFKFKRNQRLIAATGLDNPNFALPASIGASVAGKGRRTVCICEDHGFLKHAQELETVTGCNLPIKIFILNSGGHSYIRKTQKEYFGERYIASTKPKETSSKYINQIGKAYGIPTFSISKPKELKAMASKILETNSPAIAEVNIDKDQQIIPRIVFNVETDGRWTAKPLEDMYPFLDRKTFKENMIIDDLKED